MSDFGLVLGALGLLVAGCYLRTYCYTWSREERMRNLELHNRLTLYDEQIRLEKLEKVKNLQEKQQRGVYEDEEKKPNKYQRAS